MTRHRAALLATLCLLFPFLASADDPRQSANDPFVFIETALRDIGARAVECSAGVKQVSRDREMVVLCAKWDGDFESFRSRWRRQLSRVEPKTGWSINGETHDRIYAVGAQAVGVRFSMGEILIVFK